MAGGAIEEDARYWAFISYSHKDAAFGRKLHKRLESYVLPQRLVGRETARGTVPRRLVPIFRDREELPAAGDLTAEVRAALQVSRSLIVVCSPAAAASPWVAREVETFRALHPERPILAAIVEGEPAECFPGTLFAERPHGARIEPLAADFRPHHDGAGLGLLKLVAGLAGIGLDELAQRDAQRKTRRVTAITAAAFAAVLVMSTLTVFALNARTEAVRQRSEAEGLVEYMLTDLRDRLKGVGRLDIMGAVNARALHYYSDENLDSLPVDSLERRARILHAMGEDDETRGDHEAALTKFREARRTTAALLAQAPNDPERIFDHAQSEYWIGYVDFNRGRFAAAKPAFLRYKDLAAQMVAISPENTKYRREEAYAEGNLCALALKQPSNGKTALRYCSRLLAITEALLQHLNHKQSTADARRAAANDVMEAFAYMADAYRATGDIRHAIVEREQEAAILNREIATDPKNMDLKDTWIALQIALAALDRDVGKTDQAEARLVAALNSADLLHNVDRANTRSSEQRAYIQRELTQLRQLSKGE